MFEGVYGHRGGLVVIPAPVRFTLHPLDFESWDLHVDKSQTVSVM